MTVQALQAREKGMLANFKRFYSIIGQEEIPAYVDKLIEVVKSDGAYERYHFFGAVPRVSQWLRGENMKFSGFDEFTHQIDNEDYQVGVRWHQNDDADNRSPTTIDERVKEVARRFAQMRRRFLIELITGSYSLISSNPLCFDGLALFSASHAHRSGGNVYTATGMETTEQLETDLWRFVQGQREVVDPAGENVFPDDFLSNKNLNLMLLVPYTLERLFTTLQLRATDARSGVLVAVDNVVPKRFNEADIVPVNLISGTTWRIFITGMSDRKPIIEQTRQEPRPRIFNHENSDIAAMSKQEMISYDSRVGYGLKDFRGCAQFAA